MKICRFHSQMQLSAEGMPDVIDAPAPRSRLWGSFQRNATERASASSESVRCRSAVKRDRTLLAAADSVPRRLAWRENVPYGEEARVENRVESPPQRRQTDKQ